MGKRMRVVIRDVDQEGERHPMSLYPPQQKEPEPIGQQKTATERHEGAGPVRLAETDILQAFMKEYKTQGEKSESLQRRNLRLARITAVLVLFYATVAALQWRETRRANQIATKANEDGRKATADALQETEKNIAVAQKAADAASRSADAAAASVKSWITFMAARSTGVQDGKANFEVWLKNVGPTPAIAATVTWDVVFVLKGEPLPQFMNCPTGHKSMPGIFEPQGDWTTAVREPLSAEQTQQLVEKMAHLYVYGCVRYHDVLSDQERLTEVAFFFPVETSPQAPDFGGKAVGIYAPYNRMR